MNKFKTKVFKFSELKDCVILPTFQRSYVWSKDKKSELIKTIKKGLPIGTILLTEKKGKFEIIDGLQRIATLKDFYKDPFEYLQETEIDNEEILDIVTATKDSKNSYGSFSDASKKAILEDTKKLIVETIKINVDKDINEKSWCITELVIKKTSILSNEANIPVQKCIFKLLSKIEQILDINSYEIPAIIFSGTDSELVEVFTLLNSTGTKLSKYDVYAAKWNNIEINDVDDDIIEAVVKKYESSVEKSGIEISDFSSSKFRQDKKINVFEFAYSIGKLIGDKTKVIFKSKDESVVDSIGFTILAGIYNIPNKNMYQLEYKFKKQNFNYSMLKDSIIQSAKEVENELVNYILYKKDKDFAVHTEMQLASYIITYHRLIYDITDSTVVKHGRYKKDVSRFKEYLPLHYMYDAFRKYWSGSGDTILDQLVIDEDGAEHNTTILSSRYLSSVNKEEFRYTISSWISEENEKDKTTISRETKLFHNCLMKSNLNKLESYKTDFDHIVPKKRFDKLKRNGSSKIPISSPCNVTLIPEYDNRSKKEFTYYECEEIGKGVTKKYSQDDLAKFNYPTKDELSFINNKQSFTSVEYSNYINNRKEFLISEFVKLFFS